MEKGKGDREKGKQEGQEREAVLLQPYIQHTHTRIIHWTYQILHYPGL